MALTATTKLEAINTMLSAIGESPVNSLTSGLVDAEQAEIEVLAKDNENVKKIIANHPIKKVIYVKEKLINFVI